MRVLHLTSSFPRHAEDPNGPFLLDLARVQAAAGLDVHVLAPHDAGAPRAATIDGVHVTRFRYAPARAERLAYRGGLLAGARTAPGAALVPAFLASFAVAARRAVRRTRPDVVHAHWWLPGGVAGVYSHVGATRLVVTLHGSDVALLRARVLRAAARAVARRADALAAVSRPLADEAAAALGRPVAVARMPIATGASSPSPIPPSPPIKLVAIGRHAPEKGIDVLVEALASMARRGPAAGVDGGGVELDVVGDGPMLAANRARAAGVGAGFTIRFHGPMPKAALVALIDRAHAVVVPSRREGLGLVALEAMARRRPVIASDVGGLRAIVVDGVDGVLVPPGDAGALAGAIARLPLPEPRGDALASHADERVVDAHLALYRGSPV